MNATKEQEMSAAREIATKVYQGYRKESGRIDWDKVKADHPEWETALTYQSKKAKPFQKGLQIIAAMVKRGELNGAPQGTHGGKRIMSAAGRARIAAATRARWKRQKAMGLSRLEHKPGVTEDPRAKNARKAGKIRWAKRHATKDFVESLTPEQMEFIEGLVNVRAAAKVQEVLARSRFCPACGIPLQRDQKSAGPSMTLAAA